MNSIITVSSYKMSLTCTVAVVRFIERFSTCNCKQPADRKEKSWKKKRDVRRRCGVNGVESVKIWNVKIWRWVVL